MTAAVDPTAAINAIDAAMASGELTLEYAGRRMTYRSVEELLKARQNFERLLSAGQSGQPAPASASRVTYATFSRD